MLNVITRFPTLKIFGLVSSLDEWFQRPHSPSETRVSRPSVRTFDN